MQHPSAPLKTMRSTKMVDTKSRITTMRTCLTKMKAMIINLKKIRVKKRKRALLMLLVISKNLPTQMERKMMTATVEVSIYPQLWQR